MADQNYNEFHRHVPFDSIPDSDVVPDGLYELVVESIKFTWSQSKRFTINGYFVITGGDPQSGGKLVGLRFPIVGYTIGTEDDPAANDPQTWVTAFGAREFKKLLNATRTPVVDGGDIVTVASGTQGRKFQALVVMNVQKEGDYAGTERNRITRYAPLGEQVQVPGKPRGAAGGGGQGREPVKRVRPNFPTMHAPEQQDVGDVLEPEPVEVAGD